LALSAQLSGFCPCPVFVLWNTGLAKAFKPSEEVYHTLSFVPPTNHFRALKPGGWIELIELQVTPQSQDNSLPEKSQLVEFYNVLKPLGNRMGIDLDVATKFKGYLKDAGFESVQEEIFDLPVGDWPQDRRMKEIGRFQRFQMIQGLGAIGTGLLTRVGGWNKPQVEVFLAGVRREANNRSVHAFFKL
jgi:hypothetical protein